MYNKCLATIAYEVGYKVGDTTSTFLAKVKDFLNDKYDDVVMRSGATLWAIASSARLGDTDIPTLGLGEVIKNGALADAYEDKRQFGKAAKYEQKFDRSLGNFIMAGNPNLICASVNRYEAAD